MPCVKLLKSLMCVEIKGVTAMDRFIVSSIGLCVTVLIILTLLQGVFITDVVIDNGFFGVFLKIMLPALFINYLVKQVQKTNKLERVFFLNVHRRLVVYTGIGCVAILAYTFAFLETPGGFKVRIKDLVIVPAVVWYLVSSNHFIIKLQRQS